MELKSLNCPNCGASIQIPDGKNSFFCTYCGSQIHIDDGKITIDLNANINLNQKFTDVARLRELDLQEKELERKDNEERRSRRWKLYWILILLGSIILYILFMLVCSSINNILRKIICVFAGILAFVSPIVLLITFPKDWRASVKASNQSGCAGFIVKMMIFAVVLTFWACFVIIPFIAVI